MTHKKYYYVLIALVVIMVFGTAAICNLCGAGAATTDKTGTDEETASVSTAKAADSETLKDTKDSSTESTAAGTTAAGGVAPTIILEIYEGPTYSVADDICFYRIKATVTGNPAPTVTFSRDDSNGAWGNNKVQINLKKGETYTLTVTATNSAGKATESIKLNWGCGDANQNPVIAGIGISANDLLTFTEYEISTAAADPDGDPLTYKWNVDGGTLSDPSINPTKWTTPMFPETYHITVEVSDGKGGKAKETRAVRVEELNIEKANPFQVNDIIINVFPIYTNTKYYVHGDVSDPDNDIDKFYFTASGGILSDQDSNDIYWTTPINAGDYSISLIARDLQGNEDLLVVFFKVETK